MAFERNPNIRPLPKEYVWNMNWVTHALVNKVTRKEYARLHRMPKALLTDEGESK